MSVRQVCEQCFVNYEYAMSVSSKFIFSRGIISKFKVHFLTWHNISSTCARLTRRQKVVKLVERPLPVQKLQVNERHLQLFSGGNAL